MSSSPIEHEVDPSAQAHPVHEVLAGYSLLDALRGRRSRRPRRASSSE